jgi:hypothetical protein
MPLPTLLEPGSIRAHPGVTPLAYIQAWLRRRMPEYGGRDATLAGRVLVVRAKTGSGKSTVLPVGVFRLLRDEKTPPTVRYRGPSVLCTQPRVLTAVDLAKKAAADRPGLGRLYPDMVLGETVGYQTGPLSASPPAGLIYATAGVLAAQLRLGDDASLMARYRFILVDEAHERSLDCDLTLMLLRNFFLRNAGNERLPFLLLTSATFDVARYADYFGVGADNVVEVEGRAYPITTHWPATGTNDFPSAAVATVLRIHAEHGDDPPGKGDILVFVPGASEALSVMMGLQVARAPLLVLSINREEVVAQGDSYQLVFEAVGRLPEVDGRRPARRVIVSTSVAETGLTVDTLRYVVDCGWARTQEVYPPGVSGLTTRPAPRSRVEQRAGRAGRLFPGDFYPLYTRGVHAALDEQQPPDIYTAGPGSVYLALVREQQRQKLRRAQVPEFRVEDLGLLDPPPPEAFLAANATAVALGYISPRAPLPTRWPPAELEEAVVEAADAAAAPLAPVRGYGLTSLGHLAALFTRTSMEGSRVLLAGLVWGVAASDLATAVAYFGGSGVRGPWLPVRRPAGPPPLLPPEAAALRAALPPFLALRVGGGAGAYPSEAEAAHYRARLLLADDFIERVLLFDAFATRLDAARGDPAGVAGWCAELGLDFAALLGAARRRDELLEEMAAAGLDPFRAPHRRLAALPLEEFTEGARAFKRCLYDGLRGQLLRWAPDHPEGASYVTAQGLRVRTPPLFTDAMASRLRALGVTQGAADELRPRWLLTDQVQLKPKEQQLLYTVDANLVCVLDGFVDPDPDLDAPRSFAA